jgi:2',3'-cyclic-nucleotide 2'-phosphodiesterase (5'-nucleotidase family)
LKYVADYQRSPGERVTQITLATGEPLDPQARYVVAYNNFMGQGGDSLPVITYRDDATDTGILIRDAMADWIREQPGPIAVEVNGRYVARGR